MISLGLDYEARSMFDHRTTLGRTLDSTIDNLASINHAISNTITIKEVVLSEVTGIEWWASDKPDKESFITQVVLYKDLIESTMINIDELAGTGYYRMNRPLLDDLYFLLNSEALYVRSKLLVS